MIDTEFCYYSEKFNIQQETSDTVIEMKVLISGRNQWNKVYDPKNGLQYRIKTAAFALSPAGPEVAVVWKVI